MKRVFKLNGENRDDTDACLDLIKDAYGTRCRVFDAGTPALAWDAPADPSSCEVVIVDHWDGPLAPVVDWCVRNTKTLVVCGRAQCEALVQPDADDYIVLEAGGDDRWSFVNMRIGPFTQLVPHDMFIGALRSIQQVDDFYVSCFAPHGQRGHCLLYG